MTARMGFETEDRGNSPLFEQSGRISGLADSIINQSQKEST